MNWKDMSRTATCPHCGKDLTDNIDEVCRCSFCGQIDNPIDNQQRCPYCGKKFFIDITVNKEVRYHTSIEKQ